MHILAEVGLAHEGSLNLAHAYVDAVADTGAHAVKFQCHLPSEGTAEETWRAPWSYYHETRQAYWGRTAFTREQWSGLSSHAEQRGLQFGCSVFGLDAVDLLRGLLDFWKVPSGMVGHGPLLEALRDTGEPVLVSNGLGLDYPWYRVLPEAVLLECVSAYPTPLEQTPNPEAMRTITRNGARRGLSDHSGTIWPALYAVTWAEVAEVHVVFDRAMGGPDASSSLTCAELRQLCTGVAAYGLLGTHAPECTRHAAVYEPSIVDGVWAKTGGTCGDAPSTWWNQTPYGSVMAPPR